MIHPVILKPNIVSSPISFVAAETTYNSSSSSCVINKPTGVIEGDIMIATLNVNANSATINSPTGWTSIDSVSGSPISATVKWFYKVVTVSEPSSYTFDGFSTRNRGTIVAYTNTATSNPIDAYSVAKDNSSTPEATGITTTNDNSMLLYIVAADESSTTTLSSAPSGFTIDENVNGSAMIAIASDIKETAGSTGNKAGTISRTTNTGVALIALKQN